MSEAGTSAASGGGAGAAPSTGPGSTERVDTVLVIDDHPLFARALETVLRQELEVARVDSALCLADGLAGLAAGPAPAAVVLDLNLPDVVGVEGVLRLRAALPSVPILVVSSITDNQTIAEVMGSGAAGYVAKNSPGEVLVDAFRRILRGERVLPESYVEPQPAPRAAPVDATALGRLDDLTPQQARILDLVCEGKLNKQIAYELSIGEGTVKAHVTAILRKLHVHSRTQAVLVAQRARYARVLRQPS